MTRGAMVTGGWGPFYTRLGGGPHSWSGLLTTGRGYSLWYTPTGGEQSWAGLVLLEGGRHCAYSLWYLPTGCLQPLTALCLQPLGPGTRHRDYHVPRFKHVAANLGAQLLNSLPPTPPNPCYPLMRAFGPTRGLRVGTVVTAIG